MRQRYLGPLVAVVVTYHIRTKQAPHRSRTAMAIPIFRRKIILRGVNPPGSIFKRTTFKLQGCIAHLRRPSFDISYPVLQGAKDGQQTGFVAIRMEHANQIQLQNAKAYVAATSDPPTLCRRNTKCLEDEEATVARTRATFPIVDSSAHSRCLAASFYFVVR